MESNKASFIHTHATLSQIRLKIYPTIKTRGGYLIGNLRCKEEITLNIKLKAPNKNKQTKLCTRVGRPRPMSAFKPR